MKTFRVLAMVVASASLVSTLQAQSPGRKPAAGPKAETFSVVLVGDDVKVIKKSELANLRKTTAEEDKREMKAYQEAKKEAAKSKDKSDLPKRPVKRPVKVLKGAFKTEQEADDWKEKYSRDKDDHKGGSGK